MQKKARSSKALLQDIKNLRRRLDEGEQVLRGIRAGEVDALVVSDHGKDKIYSLESADQPYRILVEAMSEGAVTLAADCTILYCNARFSELVNTPLERIIAQPLLRFVAPGDRQRLKGRIQASRKKNQSGEFNLQAADGAIIPAKFSLVSLEISGARVTCAVITDLTSVMAAREARLFLGSVVDSSEDAIIGTSMNGRIMTWNAGAERMLGYTAAEAVGRSIGLIIPPELSLETSRLIEVGKAGAKALDIETFRMKKDGTRIDVSLSVSPVRDAVRRLLGTLWTLRDISVRKRAEQKFHDLLEAAPDAMVVVNQDGKIVVVNARVSQLFGYQPGELLGRQIDMLIPESSREAHGNHTLKFMDSPQVRPMGAGMDWFALRKDGTEFPVEISLSPLTTEEGTLVIIAVRDITERKRAEAEIRHFSDRVLNAQEEERHRLARELHDSTAQELAAIAINLEILDGSARLEGKAREYLVSARELAGKCSDEIRDLAHLLHPPLLSELGLHAAIKTFVEKFSLRTRIAVDLQLSPDVGRLPKETETAIFRIAQEGLNNVHRHSGSARAKVELGRDSRRVILKISDEGKGMGQGASKSQTLTKRSGFGIAGMRERARLQKGEFEISSSGKGTAIRVTFPAPSQKPSA
jgi:PAS domain S-box-containing protein